jgi:hypothetical protein
MVLLSAIMHPRYVSQAVPSGSEENAMEIVCKLGVPWLMHRFGNMLAEDVEKEQTICKQQLQEQFISYVEETDAFVERMKLSEDHWRMGGRKALVTFWKTKKYSAKYLSELGLCMGAMGSSTAPVESSFSIQGIIHSKLRNRLLSDVIKATMLVKVNKSIVDTDPECVIAVESPPPKRTKVCLERHAKVAKRCEQRHVQPNDDDDDVHKEGLTIEEDTTQRERNVCVDISDDDYEYVEEFREGAHDDDDDDHMESEEWGIKNINDVVVDDDLPTAEGEDMEEIL